MTPRCVLRPALRPGGFSCSVLILAVLSMVAATPASGGEPKGPVAPIDVGSRLELLLDDYLVESMRNLSFELHTPR